MHRLIVAGLFLLLPALALTASPQTSRSNSCSAVSASFLQDVQKGDFSAATKHFDAAMKAALGAWKLKKMWEQQLPKKFGEFERAKTPHVVHHSGFKKFTNIYTPLEFANDRIYMIVSCNNDNDIQGLFFHHAKTPAAGTTQSPVSSSAWISKAAVGAKTLPLTIQRDGFMLKGVLDLPAGEGPFGVVDIIPGSGAVDINGNAGPIQFDMYKQLAAALVQNDWAVARVAKRFMPPSTGNVHGLVFSGEVADNLAIVKALKKNPHANPERIVVAGHSLGGLIAPKLATETTLAGLILLEGPGKPMAEILSKQRARMAQKAGASATELTAFKQKVKGLQEKIVQTPPGQTVSYEGISPMGNNSAGTVQLLKSFFEQKPLETARNVHIPVLVVQGGQDIQVLPGNGKRLTKALSHGTLLYLPEMGHDLTLGQENIDKNATLAPKLTEGIADWLDSL